VKALASRPESARLHALLEVFAHGEGLAAFHKWHAAGAGDKDLEAFGISNVRTCLRKCSETSAAACR
jgi:hypothetical protein